jgi:hypothetical protein
MPSSKLTQAEIASAAWQRVEHYANERLKECRKLVENPRQSEAERLGAAWRISELKELLRLAEPAKEQQAEG